MPRPGLGVLARPRDGGARGRPAEGRPVAGRAGDELRRLAGRGRRAVRCADLRELPGAPRVGGDEEAGPLPSRRAVALGAAATIVPPMEAMVVRSWTRPSVVAAGSRANSSSAAIGPRMPGSAGASARCATTMIVPAATTTSPAPTVARARSRRHSAGRCTGFGADFGAGFGGPATRTSPGTGLAGFGFLGAGFGFLAAFGFGAGFGSSTGLSARTALRLSARSRAGRRAPGQPGRPPGLVGALPGRPGGGQVGDVASDAERQPPPDLAGARRSVLGRPRGLVLLRGPRRHSRSFTVLSDHHQIAPWGVLYRHPHERRPMGPLERSITSEPRYQTFRPDRSLVRITPAWTTGAYTYGSPCTSAETPHRPLPRGYPAVR